MIAKDIMTTDFVTINAFDDILTLPQLLLETKTDAIPVRDHCGNVVGTVGINDITEVKSGQRVQDIMIRNYISVNIKSTIEEMAAIFIMFANLRLIPVLDGQELVGVIKRSDVLKGLVKFHPTD